MADDSPEGLDGQAPEGVKPWFAATWAVINFAIGAALLLHVAGVVTLDTRAGPGLLGVVAVLLLVVGVYLVILGVTNAARRGAAPDAAQLASIRRIGNVVGTIAFALLAATMTIVAFYAWLPEQRGAFSGGLTGSVWEMRFVWGFAALVFDALLIASLWMWWRSSR